MITALWLVAACRWVVTDTVVPWDSKNQFYAFFRFLAVSLHAGVSPFWNPYHYGGHPSVADPQSLIFAPAFVLWALFDPAPSLRTFDLLVYAHLLAGGLAMGGVGVRARWPAAACVLAAALFMFGGAAAGRLQHTGIILSYALFPLALLLLQLALERRSLLIATAFAGVTTAVALGRNQVALLLCLVLAVAGLAEIATAAHPLRYLRERAAVLVVMTAIGLALTALPVLLTLQFAALSNRSMVLLDSALAGSLYPPNLAQLVVADIFGSHDLYWGPSAGTIAEVALTDDSFNYVFVGSVPIVLLLWFGVIGGGAFRRGRLLLTAVLTAALLFALGRYTLLFAWAFEWVPGVHWFRRPVDGNFIVLGMLALLAGHLLADYLRAGLPRLRRLRSVVVVGAALAIMVSAVMFSQRSGHGAAALVAVLQTLPISLGVIALLVTARAPQARAGAATIVVAVAVAELLWWNAAFRLNAESRSHYAVLDQPVLADARSLAVLERAIRERQAAGERPRVEIVGMGGRGRTLRWCAGWKRPTATIRCASACTIVWWRPARRTGAWSCATSRPPSTAMIARLHARSGSNSSCSTGRSKRFRTSRAVRSPTCCRPVRTYGSTVCARRRRASRSPHGSAPRRAKALARRGSSPGGRTVSRSRPTASRAACWRCTIPIIPVGSPRSMAARRPSCAPVCCSAASYCRPAHIAWCSASLRSRSTI
jgi:hypothetical protein